MKESTVRRGTSRDASLVNGRNRGRRTKPSDSTRGFASNRKTSTRKSRREFYFSKGKILFLIRLGIACFPDFIFSVYRPIFGVNKEQKERYSEIENSNERKNVRSIDKAIENERNDETT